MPIKTSSKEAYEKLFDTHGDTISMFDYISAGKDANFLCNVCGHTWTTKASEVITQGTGCQMCGYIRTRMLSSVLREDAEDRLFKNQNGTVELLEYDILSSPATFRCLICGYEWGVKHAIDIINGKRHCPNCWSMRRKNPKISMEEIIFYIESKNCKFVDFYEKYIGTQSKILIQFECGHVFPMQFASFKDGQRCRVCGKRSAGDKMKRPVEKIINDLNIASLTFIDFPNGYENGVKSEIKYSCEFGHTVTCKINTFYKHPRCIECFKAEFYKGRQGKGHPNWIDGKKSDIESNIRTCLSEWKIESLNQCNNRCTITGNKIFDLHHLVSFTKIIDEAHSNLGFIRRRKISDYSEDDYFKLIEKVKRLHYVYPLGICIRHDLHLLFHSSKMYGNRNFTPDDFYEFCERIDSGDIQLPT